MSFSPLWQRLRSVLLFVILFILLVVGIFQLDIHQWNRHFIFSFSIATIALILVLFLFLLTWLAIDIRSAYRKYSQLKSPAYIPSDSSGMVVNQKNLHRPLARTLEFFFSASAWLLILYFIHTLSTTILWMVGTRIAWVNLFFDASLESTLYMMLYAVYYALFIFLVLLCWTQWNYWRYGRLERRRPHPPISDADAAQIHGMSPEALQVARTLKQGAFTPTAGGIELIPLEYLTPDSARNSDERKR